MRMSEERVFLFTFQTDAGDISIPIRAQSSAEAGDKMQKMLSRIQTELALEFPKIQSAPAVDTLPISLNGPIPPEVLEMRLDTLMGDLGGAHLVGKAKAKTIKDWTGLELKEENYIAIITKLEELKAEKQNG